jgi:outer membrane protein, heavy metal efflux system
MPHLLLLALLSAAPPPAPTLHLEALLAEARAHNPQLQAATFRASGAEASAGAAGALEAPRFMVQLWNAPADFSSVPVMFQLSQGIPLGGKLGLRRKLAETEAAAASAEAQGMARTVEAEVARAFFELYRAERTRAVDNALALTLEAIARAAEARLRSGRGEQAEVLKAQAAALELEEDLEVAAQEEAGARAQLRALLDRSSAVEGTTPVPRVLETLPSEDALRARALQHRSEPRVAAALEEGSQLEVQLAKAERAPDLNVLAAYMHSFNLAGEQNFLFAGVELTLPWLWGKTGERISAAHAQAEAASATGRGVAARIGGEVAEAYARVGAQARLVGLHHRMLPLLQAALESSRAAYAAGGGNFLLVLDTVREVRRHQLELAMALAGYGRALADLQRAVGEDLGLLAASEGGMDDAHH